jgi:hypothetical protein
MMEEQENMVQKFCKACGAALTPGEKFCPKCLVKAPDYDPQKVDLFLKDTPENRAKKLMEYKVVGQEDMWLNGGRFDKISLEKMLNYYAHEGWKVREITTSKTVGVFLGTPRDEMIVILERDMQLEPV